jgi:D-alanine-D-alanine ligase
MKTVALFFGGKSVEHDISIITALQTMKSFPKEYKLFPIYIKPDGEFVTAENLKNKEIYLNLTKNAKKIAKITLNLGKNEMFLLKNNKIKQKTKIDCALICNHGHGGEDGSLQGLLELCDIPYTSCSLTSSAVCMDKELTKILITHARIPTPKFVSIKKVDSDLKKIEKEIGYPCIIKPSRCGSSVGINIASNENDLKNAVSNAFLFDDKVIIEQFVSNAREFCCAVVKNGSKLFASKVDEVEKGNFYTFEEKYLQAKNKNDKKIQKSLADKIVLLAKKTYDILDCDGVVRIDFLLGQDGKLFVNEVNSIPGSLAFNLFDGKFEDLLCTIIEMAIKKHEEKKDINYTFSSSAIQNFINISNSQKSGKME